MLPIGGTVMVVSAIALAAIVTLGVDIGLRRPGGWGWWLAWCLVAAGVTLWHVRSGIEMMSAFDWRPLPGTLLRSAGVMAGWLALP